MSISGFCFHLLKWHVYPAAAVVLLHEARSVVEASCKRDMTWDVTMKHNHGVLVVTGDL